MMNMSWLEGSWMHWYQENWLGVVFFSIMVVILLRGPILSWIYRVQTISVHDLAAKLSAKNPPVLLDVRTPAEFETGYVAQAILVPLQEMGRIRTEEIRNRYPDREFAVICRSGSRSCMAAVNLRKVGVPTVYNVMGGITAWRQQGYPIRK